MRFSAKTFTNNGFLLSKHKITIVICALFMLIPFINHSQTQDLARHTTAYDLTLKSSDDFNKSTAEVITEEISEQGATWLRLFFKDVNLGKNSTLTITSKLDGATQTLNSKTIKEWSNSTAYFNGDAVTVTLSKASSDAAVSLSVSELSVGELDPGIKSICGSSDNRGDSNDDAIGRIVPIGCTGWIIRNGRLVTAGHCLNGNAQVIEFNVPKSNPDRTIVHPGPEDQYPIGNFNTPYQFGVPVTDWGVFTASANSQTGQTPIQAQGKSFNVVQSSPGNTIRITGYGTDSGIDNQTQQTHTGPLTSFDTNFVNYRTDTTGGNSGSPIIDTATGNAVGVHAYGGCSGSSGANFGERATIPAFWNALGLGNTGISGPTVRMIKRNASGYALDGGNGGADGQNVYLWSNSASNINQQWIEVNQGGGYYSYVKKGTNYALDGGNGGGRRHNVYLWTYNKNNFNQHWRKVNVGGGHYRLEKRNASAYSIDGNNGGGNGQNTYLWDSSNGNQNQHWRFITISESVTATEAIATTEEIGNDPDLSEKDISIFPNPARDSFTISFADTDKNATAIIYSLLGERKGLISLKQGANRVNVSSLSLSSGIYLLEITSSKGITSQKLVVQ
ncbi:T9SS type A sorting domain-containing protein [Aquimarina sp. SS2-1]|uniref:T9SS type A sorting domain-containing protein n=1 Tax=Aquimarina besae TaxID=3342247 RepID=UPI00366D88F7